MSPLTPLHVLLLCDRPPRVAETLHQHIDALASLPGMSVRVVSILGDAPPALDFDRFDVVVIHYSLVICNDQYVSATLRARLRASRALKAVFIQDEYRHVDRTIAALCEIDVGVLFTCMPDKSIEQVYSEVRLPGVRKVNVLTGYVQPDLHHRSVKPLNLRNIDVGYRARKVPAWLGDLGQDKWEIGQRFAAEARSLGLTCDISYREEERLYGDAWIRFVSSCKAILGVESGSSVFDFSGAIQAAVEHDVAANPLVTYEELKRRHFATVDGLIDQRQISPRCFEAAALRTLMILYEGDYSGLMEPWRHYVPLAKDHSNMTDVVATLRDNERSQAIVDRAYKEVACNPLNQFSTHTARVASVLREEHARRCKERAVPYQEVEFEHAQLRARTVVRRLMIRKVITYTHYILFRWILKSASERRRDKVGRWLAVQLRKTAAGARRLFPS
jgi:hypothetical protein